ncbi:uncharacterized protein [Argopecten irradians]|uniref:uncharacterized protein n=1 Tax=Argopecten irradians TaxID=31199 RepID=UPI0037227F4A
MTNQPPPELDLITSDGNIAERWRKWEQTMRLYLDIALSGKNEKEKCSAFLYIIGQDGRDVYNTMNFEEGQANKIEPLFNKFKLYCQPSENTIVWRHRFNTRTQGKTESIDQFATELRTIASKCKFDALNDELIRDRIVCGVNNEKIKERLLRDQDLTLAKAISTCRASEETSHMMKNLHGEAVIASVTRRHTSHNRPRSASSSNQRGPPKQQPKFESSKTSSPSCKKCGLNS